MYFMYESVDWEIKDNFVNVTTQDYNSGDEPFSMTFKADVEITNISISFATATPFYVLVNVGHPSASERGASTGSCQKIDSTDRRRLG